MRFSFIVQCSLMALLVAFNGGCLQTLNDSWKTVRSYHYEYLNTPAEVDKESVPEHTDAEVILCESMVPVEQQLVPFERALFAIDYVPDMDWISGFLQRFPWVNGIAVVNPDGIPMQRYPETSLKPLDFSLIAKQESKTDRRLLKAVAQSTVMGPEVFVAAPLMHNTELIGYLVAHFDPRALIGISPLADDIVVMTPGMDLWPGKYEYAKTPLPGADWPKLLEEELKGTVSNGAGTFVWIVRYLGSLPLVFGAPVSGTFEEVPGQTEILRSYTGNQFVLPAAQPTDEAVQGTEAVQESDITE